MIALAEPRVSAVARVARPSLLAAVARSLFWRIAWFWCGGLRTSGRAPSGPAIVVANHRSHADSAALLAAFPIGTDVVFAAAADYWFATRRRRWLTRALMPSVSVERAGGGFAALRATAAPVLARGAVLVIYPEGTRCESADLGDFKAGAARLGAGLGVPISPVAIEGTQRTLPKAGRLRRRGAGVHFGQARELDLTVDPQVASAGLRQQVIELLPQATLPDVSRAWLGASRIVTSRRAPVLALAWGVAEALSWPFLAEISLVFVAVAVPNKVVRQAIFLALGSVVGIVLHAWLVGHGVHVPLPLTTDRMAVAAAADLATGPWGLSQQAFSGIPVKVYAHEAGLLGLDLGALGVAAAMERGARILGVGLVLAVLAHALHPILRRHYGWYLLATAATFIAALIALLRAWS